MQVSSPPHCRPRHQRVACEGVPGEAAINQYHNTLRILIEATTMVNSFLAAEIR
jgi:hypothetical protein